MRRAARVDAPHADIVRALRRVGCRVYDASRCGQGFPDLVVQWHGQILLLEVKTARGKLTADQQAFMDQGWLVHIVRSIEQALRVVGVTR